MHLRERWRTLQRAAANLSSPAVPQAEAHGAEACAQFRHTARWITGVLGAALMNALANPFSRHQLVEDRQNLFSVEINPLKLRLDRRFVAVPA